MKTEPLSVHIAVLIDEIIQWKIESGDLPDVLKKRLDSDTPPYNETRPFFLAEYYDWMIQELDVLGELPHNVSVGEMA